MFFWDEDQILQSGEKSVCRAASVVFCHLPPTVYIRAPTLDFLKASCRKLADLALDAAATEDMIRQRPGETWGGEGHLTGGGLQGMSGKVSTC